MPDLNTICFLMFGFLFIGFLVLEGFDYGVGMLLPFLGKSDSARRAIIATLAPVWEGNEVWLIAAGTVLFAGFPDAYATLFSGLYLALILILVTLILRGVAFEFRNKDINKKWRTFWDWSIFFGGIIPALLWGIAVANLLYGLPISEQKQYVGDFWDLITIYSLVGGLAFVFLFLFHGAAYLTLKLERNVIPRLRTTGILLGRYTVFILVCFAILTMLYTNAMTKPIVGVILMASVVTAALGPRYMARNQYISSFALSTLSIIAINTAIFTALFPWIIISNLDLNWSLDIYNAASNLLTLNIMVNTLYVVLPIVLLLETWKYYIFRQSVNEDSLESRRKLWSELYEQIRGLISHLQSIRMSLEKKQCALANQEAAKRMRQLRILLQCGRQMITIFDVIIKALRRF